MALGLDIVSAIAQRLSEYAGLELRGWVIDARASARIARLGVSPHEYVDLIRRARGTDELEALIEAVRVGESRLFRHRGQIKQLVKIAESTLHSRGAIRVWSAGCAAGQEPYTLAIVLSRALPDCSISILGTDVSADALAQATAATYPRSVLDHVPPKYRDTLVEDGEVVRVAPEVARLVRFERANLLDGPAPRDCDLVWCCNVMIYFTPEARARVIDRLVAATATDGFVFVGYSESLRDIPELEDADASSSGCYRRRDPAQPPRSPAPAARRSETDRMRRARWTRIPPGERTTPPDLSSQTPDGKITLRGQPTVDSVTAEISTWLAVPGLDSLTIDLDGVELLDDELAAVFRRARYAAWLDGISLYLCADRPGPTRWLARHGLDDNARTLAERTSPPLRRR
jgi:chemotaxis protein methyltransferase CheR